MASVLKREVNVTNAILSHTYSYNGHWNFIVHSQLFDRLTGIKRYNASLVSTIKLILLLQGSHSYIPNEVH